MIPHRYLHMFWASAIWLICVASCLAQDTVMVHGITGRVAGSTKRVFYPGDEVTIRVLHADLLRFTYGFSPQSVAIHRNYYVNGVAGGILIERAGTPSAAGNSNSFAIALKTTSCESVGDIGDAIQKLNNGVDIVNEVAGTIDNVYTGRSQHINPSGDSLWVHNYFDTTLDKLPAAIGNIEKALARFLEVRDQTDCTNDMCKCFIETAKRLINIGNTALRHAKEQQSLLLQWQGIMKTTAPVVEYRVLVEGTAKRYTVSVTRASTRTALAVPAAGSGQATEDANKAEAVAESGEATQPKVATANDAFAVVTFDGHTKGYALFTVGFAGLETERSYEFTPTVRRAFVEDPKFEGSIRLRVDTSYVDSVYYSVREIPSRFKITPIVSIGCYFGGVDDLDVGWSDWWHRFYVFGGSEIALRPDHLFFGLGYDFPNGLNLAFGAATRKSKTLVSPWTVGSPVITATAKTTVGDPPVESTIELTYSANISFRPVFITTLFGLIKSLLPS